MLNDDKVNQALILNHDFLFSHSTTNARDVGLHEKNDLISIREQDLKFDSNDSENLFVEIKLTSKKEAVIGVLCRHLISNFSKFQEQLSQTFYKFEQNKHDFLVCGDFNITFQSKNLSINDY